MPALWGHNRGHKKKPTRKTAGMTGGLGAGGVTAASACRAVSRRRRDGVRLLGIDDALRVGALNLPPVVLLVLVVEVSDSRDVRRMAVDSSPMRCRLLGSE